MSSSLSYLKQELNSFIEDDRLHIKTNLNSIPENNDNFILAPFPLKTEEELMGIECKIKSEDLTYTNKLVCTFIIYNNKIF